MAMIGKLDQQKGCSLLMELKMVSLQSFVQELDIVPNLAIIKKVIKHLQRDYSCH